jgi:hypothetical protein
MEDNNQCLNANKILKQAREKIIELLMLADLKQHITNLLA